MFTSDSILTAGHCVAKGSSNEKLNANLILVSLGVQKLNVNDSNVQSFQVKFSYFPSSQHNAYMELFLNRLTRFICIRTTAQILG